MGSYSLAGHGEMIGDTRRMDAYEQALRRTVTPQSVVLDIGTGTGIFALLACRFGARKVFALETDDVIQVARSVARDNGYAERIEFIQAPSTEVELGHPADVVISDLRGVLPWFEHHIPTIMDARDRHLAPGGIMIPACDTLWAAVVEAPELHGRYTGPWEDRPFGLDMEAASRLLLNTWGKGPVREDQLLSRPEFVARIDYHTVHDTDMEAEVALTVERAGRGYGINMWFDATVADGIQFSNGPGAPEHIYGSAFFPWTRPVDLEPGDRVEVALRADLVCDDYTWSWNTTITAPQRSATEKAAFRQSTFFGVPLSPDSLKRSATDNIPSLNEDGRIHRSILEAMSRETRLGDIANGLVKQFPARFATESSALDCAAAVCRRFAEASPR